ncbi:hypothetical protein C8R45DRAFT_948267 [Mycena sanguinolenta]|nr:hypothetical protein C8R45DRAFT_948267 [Mycena sanguinolenta]
MTQMEESAIQLGRMTYFLPPDPALNLAENSADAPDLVNSSASSEAYHLDRHSVYDAVVHPIPQCIWCKVIPAGNCCELCILEKFTEFVHFDLPKTKQQSKCLYIADFKADRVDFSLQDELHAFWKARTIELCGCTYFRSLGLGCNNAANAGYMVTFLSFKPQVRAKYVPHTASEHRSQNENNSPTISIPTPAYTFLPGALALPAPYSHPLETPLHRPQPRATYCGAAFANTPFVSSPLSDFSLVAHRYDNSE